MCNDSHYPSDSRQPSLSSGILIFTLKQENELQESWAAAAASSLGTVKDENFVSLSAMGIKPVQACVCGHSTQSE